MRLNGLWARLVEWRTKKARQGKLSSRRKGARLSVEALEHRVTPAAHIWTGNVSNLWDNPSNWTGGVPTTNEVGGATLSFGATGRRDSFNNIPGLVVNTITFDDVGYQLKGNAFSVRTQIVSNATGQNDIFNQMTMVAGDRAATLRVPDPGGTLALRGRLVGGGTLGLSKSGEGTVLLAGDNILFTGAITIEEGPLNISHANALGNTIGKTTVLATSATPGQLGILGNITVIAEPLILNGDGFDGDGALVNVSGTNVWTGTINLNSSSTIGANADTLGIQGVISSTGTQSLTKEGAGTIILDPLRSEAGNTYGGRTFVNEGILAIRHSRALGNSTTPLVGVNDTVVVSEPLQSGTLRLDFVPDIRRKDTFATATGFTVPFEALTLNGPGYQGIDYMPKTLGVPPISQTVFGALHNNRGNNTWTQDVSLWTDDSTATNFNVRYWDWATVGIGVEATTTLTLTGNINDDNLSDSLLSPDLTSVQYSLIKTRPGRLILTGDQTVQLNGPITVSANTYRGRTEVLEGYLNIRDSAALGATGFEPNGTYVFSGGTLELEADTLPDSNPAGAAPDGRLHLDTDLVISAERLYLQGTGADSTGSSGAGALRNVRGTNEITGDVPLRTQISRGTLEGFVTFIERGVWIGVEPDMAPYDQFNLSQLTLSGTVLDGNLTPADLFKTGAGELVLTADQNGSTGNTYTGVTYIMQGWITARSDRALGGDISSRGLTVQPNTHVAEGTALHLKRTRGTNLDITLAENLWLAGDGISHRFDELNHNGALLSLSGKNVVSGDINLIAKSDYPLVGIGADLDPLDSAATTPGELTLTGKVSQTPLSFQVPRNAAGAGIDEDRYLVDTGSISGTLQISYDFINGTGPDRMTVYYEGRQIYDTGVVNGPGTFTVPYGTGDSTFVEIVMNEGSSGTAWQYTALVIPDDRDAGITKFGHKRLNLQGPGTYAGNVVVAEGVLRTQSDTALGVGLKPEPTSTADLRPGNTSVQSGTALEIGGVLPQNSGGLVGGAQIRDAVTLIGPGLAETQRITVQGTGGWFRLTFGGKTTGLLPYNATAVQVSAALNALTTIGAGGVIVSLATDVTTSTNYYTVTFLGAKLVGLDLAPLTVTPVAPTVVAVNTVINGGIATLTSMGQDNVILGQVTLTAPATGYINLDTNQDSRLSLRGNVIGTGGLFKRGTGKLVLAGNNSYQGTTQITAGIVNLQSSTALGLPNTVVRVGRTPVTVGGTVVADNAQIEIQGDINVAAESLTILGNGPNTTPNIPLSWFAQGPGPILNGQTTGRENVTGRITGVATDPSDANVLYVSTASGGAWRSRDNGLSWEPLIDSAIDNLGNPLPYEQTLFTGAIAVAPTQPNVIYVGLGDPNNALESYYGNGLLKSTDYGRSWTLLAAPLGAFNRESISRIVVDPQEADTVYVAVQGNATNGGSGAGAGIWRYRNGTWANLSGVITGTFTDLVVLDTEDRGINPDNRIIAFAVSDYEGNAANVSNVYTAIDASLTTTTPTWLTYLFPMGTGLENFTATGRSGATYLNQPRDGLVKLTASRTFSGNQTVFTFYASVAYPLNNPRIDQGSAAILREIRTAQFTYDRNRASRWATQNWRQMANPPGNYMGGTMGGIAGGNNFPSYPGIAGQGWYAQTIEVDPTNPNMLFVGGMGQAPNLPGQPTATYLGPYLWDGTSWINIGDDSSAPHVNYHDAIFDSRGRLIVGTDGGIWVRPARGLTGAALDTQTWTNVNGNFLQIAEMTGLDVAANNPSVAVGGTLTNGTVVSNGSVYWKLTGDGNGGLVRIDNDHPNIVYSYQNGDLRRSTDGGQTWTTIHANTGRPPNEIVPFPYLLDQFYYPGKTSSSGLPFVVDPLDPTRVLVVARDNNNGDDFSMLKEADVKSNNPTWGRLGDSYNGFGRIISIGLAGYQGTYVYDSAFPSALDQGSDKRDLKTIYLLTTRGLFLTKNNGADWVQRDTGLPGLPNSDAEVVVDPRNRDTAYVVRHVFGGQQVWRTTDAGKTWTNISGTLPDLPAWKLVVNSLNGDLYLGNDNGVYRLSAANLAAATYDWERLGVGLPNVQVKQLVFSPRTNVLSAGTFGRGLYQIWLDPSALDREAGVANRGSIRVVSGQSTWDGGLTLTGNTELRVERGAELDFTGIITDGANTVTVTKLGEGRAIFSGANNYGGLTDVQEGFLRVANPTALGVATPTGKYVGGALNGVHNDTIVRDGATLEMESDLTSERVELIGDGVPFSDRPLGALRNVSSPLSGNTFTGTLVLADNATIGVDSGSQLTIGTKVGLRGIGVITDEAGVFSLTKEGLGTLVLNTRNTYDGTTTVSQGILTITLGSAGGISPLGSTLGGTDVQDGAQLQLQGLLTVTGEALELSGEGIRNGAGVSTGALLVSGYSTLRSDPVTWNGPVTLDGPPLQAWVNVVDVRDVFTITGAVGGDGGLWKTGPGRLMLPAANTYTGLTTVEKGVVQIQTPTGLGTSAGGTEVRDGAVLELNLPAGTNTLDEAFTLLGNGIAPGNAGALLNLRGTNTVTGNVLLQGNSTVSVNPGTELTFSGVISDVNPSSLTKKGTGKLILSGANTFRGPTIITGGNVQVDGTAADVQLLYNRLAPSVLSGGGQVGAITGFGTVSPGVHPGGTADLQSAGTSWNGTITYAVNLNGTTVDTGYDQLVVNGNITLGGARLTGTAVAGFTVGDTFTIVRTTGAGTITGTFYGLVNNAVVILSGQRFRINYTTTAVTLTRI